MSTFEVSTRERTHTVTYTASSVQVYTIQRHFLGSYEGITGNPMYKQLPQISSAKKHREIPGLDIINRVHIRSTFLTISSGQSGLK